MATIFEFETRFIDEARLRFTETGIPSMVTNTPLWYNARMGRIEGDQQGFRHIANAQQIALCTIQEKGSAERGYQSISTAGIFRVPLIVGARSNDHLLVSDVMSAEGELLHPARLSLQDLIGYRTLQRV